ncbi:MAG TPA: cytochrome P450 [Steroidobacteraceae bacterium]|nr:cytochrome P450 [Steroidobacteraceae bacterium]
MTTLDNPVSNPILPAPVPRQRRLSFFEFVGALRNSAIDSFAQEAYELDILERRIFGRRLFVLNDLAAIKHVLIDNAANYQKTEITRRILEPGLGKGLITSEGETWRQHRRAMSPAFDHRSIAAYTPVMTGAAEELLAEWGAVPAGSAIDVQTAMMEVTLNIISRTMFSSDSDDIVTIMGRSAGRYQAEMRPNIMDMMGWPKWLAGLPRNRVAQRTLGEFDQVIDRLIDERTRDPGTHAKDLLARLIAARDEQTGGGMSAQEVRDHVITIFLAGHETTAMAMTWTWFLLSQHPYEEAKLHAELDSVLGGRVPTHEDLSKLIYTRMVVEESMRIYPPVHTIGREAIGADTLAGRLIPKGSTILIAPWLLHRHVKLWENPGRFDPERFSPKASAARPRFSYLPFGGGKRICIGAAFALAEATVLLATLAQRYKLRVVPGHKVEPQGLITLRARHGMKMLLTPRSQGFSL